MSLPGVIDEAYEELAIVAELHAPIIINPPVPDLIEDGLSEPGSVNSNSNFYHLPPPKQERSMLRVNTQLGHVLLRPPAPASRSRLSLTPTSESDRDDTRRTRDVRPVASLPSFHPPQGTRSTSYRDRGVETPPLTSESHSSLTSSPAISQSSFLHTPPHSPPAAPSFVYSEITNPSPHLSVISEPRNTDDRPHHISLHPLESKSTQTLTRTDRPGPSSIVHNENEGGSVIITPRSAPRPLDPHVYYPEKESPTETVTGLFITATAPAPIPCTTEFSSPMSPLHSTSRTASPGLSSFSSLSSPATVGGLAWPFGGRSKGDASMTKAQKTEEKKRKKEEARARKQQLAEELKRRAEMDKGDNVSFHSTRSNERIARNRPWEEDIVMFGGLASM